MVLGEKNVDIFTHTPPPPPTGSTDKPRMATFSWMSGSSIQLEENSELFVVFPMKGKHVFPKNAEKNEGAPFERMFILIHPEMSGMC